MTKRSEQAIVLRWRSARMRWIDGLRSMAVMVQNPLDDCGFLDDGDDARPNAAWAAGLCVDGEHPLEAVRSRLITRCRSVGDGSPRLLVAAVRVLHTIRTRQD